MLKSLPCCRYDIRDYFRQWLAIGRRAGACLPRNFSVNWFREVDAGSYGLVGLPRAGIERDSA